MKTVVLLSVVLATVLASPEGPPKTRDIDDVEHCLELFNMAIGKYVGSKTRLRFERVQKLQKVQRLRRRQTEGDGHSHDDQGGSGDGHSHDDQVGDGHDDPYAHEPHEGHDDAREMAERFDTFKKALKTIADIEKKHKSFVGSINPTSVTTKHEQKCLKMLHPPDTPLDHLLNLALHGEGYKLPPDVFIMLQNDKPPSKAVNWVLKGTQHAVREQAECASCWAFSAVNTLEANYYLMTGKLLELSEQEYLDCTYDNQYLFRNVEKYRFKNGCYGGWMSRAWEYSEDRDRLSFRKDNPYMLADRECRDMTSYAKNLANALVQVKVKGTEYIGKTDEDLFKAASEGVVSVAIEANDEFMVYRSGLFVGVNCRRTVNHAVNLVGYTEEYWNVKNTWGPHWGEGGYIKMSRRVTNHCNIALYPMRPKLECREGHVCTPPDLNLLPDDPVLRVVPVGDLTECGRLVHSGGKCVSLDDTGAKYAELSVVCSHFFCLTSKGFLYDKDADMCMNVTEPVSGLGKVFFSLCTDDTARWVKAGVTSGFEFKIKDADTGRCWKPSSKWANPKEGTNIGVTAGCGNEPHYMFSFDKQSCWVQKQGKVNVISVLKNAKQRKIKYKTLDAAKRACVTNKECKSVWETYNKKQTKRSYFLSNSVKIIRVKKRPGAVNVEVVCSYSCDKGQERCNDGKCRKACNDPPEECPPATIRCGSGKCTHASSCRDYST